MATLQSTLKLTLLDQVSGRARVIAGALQGLERSTNRIGGMMRGVLAFGATYFGVTEGIKDTVGASMSFESAFANVKKVVEASDEQFQNMSATIRKMSTQLPITANDLAALYAAAGESGIATKDLNQFALMASRVGIAFDMTAGDAGDSLAKLKTQLGLTVSETGDVADAINALSNAMASNGKDIVAFMLRVGALSEMGGLAKEQIAALGSAMIAAGAEPEVAATAMQNVVKAMTKGASAKKSQRQVAAALGLNLPQLAKDMQKDAPGAIKKVLAAIAKTPKDRHIALLSDFFGDEAKAFAPLVDHIELLDQALDTVSDKTKYAGSAYKEYLARASTTANVLQILQNKFAELGRSIGDDMLPSVKEAALGIGDIIDTLDQRATVFDQLSTAVKGFVNGLGMKGGIRDAINELGDLLLGPADGSKAADTLGRIFAKFKAWGEDVRAFSDAIKNSPVGQFLSTLGGLGFKLATSAVGISLAAGAIRRLARALFILSGMSTAVGILKTVAQMQTALNGVTKASSFTGAAASTGTTFGTLFAAAAGAAIAAGLLVALKELDPKGDLWGFTKPIDDWFEKNTGWNPAKDGLTFTELSDKVRSVLPGFDGLKLIFDALAKPTKEKPAIQGANSVADQQAIDNAAGAKRLLGMGGTTDTEPGKTKDDRWIQFPTDLKQILEAARLAAKRTGKDKDDGEPDARKVSRVIDQALNNRAADETLRRRFFEDAFKNRPVGIPHSTTDDLPGKRKDDQNVKSGPKVKTTLEAISDFFSFRSRVDTFPGKRADDVIQKKAEPQPENFYLGALRRALGLDAIFNRATEEGGRRQQFERDTTGTPPTHQTLVAPPLVQPIPQASGIDTLQQSIANALALENAIRAKAAGMGGTTDTEPGKLKDDQGIGAPKTVSIDAASISAMIQPAGVQQVMVTNQQPVSVTVSAPITVTGVSDPKAAANSAASQLGAKVKSAVNASFGAR